MHNWRRHEREHHSKAIDMSVNVLKSSRLEKVAFMAETVDISQGGLGIVTDFFLQPGFVKFEGIDEYVAGIVVWSRKQADSTCRAGIRFIQSFTKRAKYLNNRTHWQHEHAETNPRTR